MKYLVSLLLASVMSMAAFAQPTDLVIQMVWQDSTGAVVDSRYLRMVVGPDCTTDNKDRVLWSSRKNSDMVGRVMCLESGAPVPSMEIGEFTVTAPGVDG